MIELIPISADKLIREYKEEVEHDILSRYATFSDSTKGRMKEEKECDLRPCFQRDRDRVLYSRAFRRLSGKTQVFLDPEGDHYRTRLTHTLEVNQTARAISAALRLNEDLTDAISLAHDLGHTPFGHAGERALNRAMNESCGKTFKHFVQSLRVVDRIEKHGEGLNLTWEVRDGIVNHQVDTVPATLEGKVVRLSDKIAYINHDIDDAIRGNIITDADIPKRFTDVLGHSLTSRLNVEIHDIIRFSLGRDDVGMSPELMELTKDFRDWMFANVYTNPVAKGQENKAEELVEELFRYYLDNVDRLPEDYKKMLDEGEEVHQVVADYVSGMTDRFAIARYKEIRIPFSWDVY
ncbi:MAG: deoxyguanosinetriphosphate triphosphohydrolase [Lachnospiraceae bacterium]|nr:deoxyguanosinetriphosphate triphosphohydrolase [Lachnospiraceae bacterium]